MHFSLNLTNDTADPIVTVLAIGGTGARFLVVDLGPGISMILPGLDAEGIVYAQKLIAALGQAVAQMAAARAEG